MEHNHIKIWLHVVFATKYRKPFITKEIEPYVHSFLTKRLEELNCSTLAINGIEDHVHILFALNPEKSISDVMKHIKGGSSHSINKEIQLKEKFRWQSGYGCFSVGESALSRVQRYIVRQKEHHRTVTTNDEIGYFRKLAGNH